MILGFQPPACKLHCPRQGKDTRLCVVTRKRVHRSLLWRVVRTRRDGKHIVTVDDGEGRSAYVSKDFESVAKSTKKNRLGKALRCAVPHDVIEELKRRAREWDQLSNFEKGLIYCEVYGVEGVSTALDQVQEPILGD